MRGEGCAGFLVVLDHGDDLAPMPAAGIILTNVWNNQKIVTIDQLGNEFLKLFKMDKKLRLEKTTQ